MAIDVKIPPMGESITSGILARWHVQDQSFVKKGQVLFELETDKITSEGTAEASGVLHIRAQAGEEVKIGQVVAMLDESAVAEANPTDNHPVAAAPSAVSPAVRRLAEQTGINPADVAGTGKAGHVTKGDMLAHASAPQQPEPIQPAAASAPCAHHSSPTLSAPQTTRHRMTPLRRRIAERLVQAQQQTASLTTFNEVDLSAVMRLREQYQEAFTKKYGIKLGFMSFFVKAVVHALKHVPAINAQVEGEEVIQNHYYDIGVAVGTEKGLVVPVVREADTQSFAEIEQQISAYAKKAREGKITLDDLQGGVFTISNGGIYGSMLSTPILNTPQSAILGMHAIQQRPVAVAGEVVIRPMMYLALTYDHRLVDGKEAVTFLLKIKEAIEEPTRLLFNI